MPFIRVHMSVYKCILIYLLISRSLSLSLTLSFSYCLDTQLFYWLKNFIIPLRMLFLYQCIFCFCPLDWIPWISRLCSYVPIDILISCFQQKFSRETIWQAWQLMSDKHIFTSPASCPILSTSCLYYRQTLFQSSYGWLLCCTVHNPKSHPHFASHTQFILGWDKVLQKSFLEPVLCF